jgi:hypothetical protein
MLAMVVFGGPAGYVSYFSWSEIKLERRLLSEGVEKKATVLSTNISGGGGDSGDIYRVRYSFQEGGRAFTNEVRVNRDLYYTARLGASIPILHLPGHPEANLPVARTQSKMFLFAFLFAGGVTLLCGLAMVTMTVKLLKGGYEASSFFVTGRP